MAVALIYGEYRKIGTRKDRIMFIGLIWWDML